MSQSAALNAWVESVAKLTRPDQVHWCDGSEAEFRALVAGMQANGELLPLNAQTHPGCYLHRSHPDDVARTEHLTFICTAREADAGPNNNWREPQAAHRQMEDLFKGCMQGRTLFVVPYCMGPLDSPLARCGVEITDSPYVVVSMRIMTRMGSAALKRIEREQQFVRGLHSLGELDPERRFIMHFPEQLLIMSYGSGYGGNALLGKKCHALRIASWQARREGWLAEHMLVVGIENPAGEVHYLAAAFPSACGKTNLAMLQPPSSHPGWKVWTVGDDICWMQPGADGRLWAINPEAGFFGVAPGTSGKTNPAALAMLGRDAIFTNVALTSDQQPWWEGLDERMPVTDWRGRPWLPGQGPAAHPNSRFTVAARACPTWTEQAEAPAGVPISAIVFGGRRRNLVPLVMEAHDWQHGVLLGAGMASETTAAATGKVGVVRRDPMAMQPFCGYNFGDYWRHWLELGAGLKAPPRIFNVNWFRRGANDRFLWPGFGHNLRVLEWIIKRCTGTAAGSPGAIGVLPEHGAIATRGLDLAPGAMDELLRIDAAGWQAELKAVREYLVEYGERTPPELLKRVDQVQADLSLQY